MLINSFLNFLWEEAFGLLTEDVRHTSLLISVFCGGAFIGKGQEGTRVPSGNGEVFLFQLPVKGVPFLRSASVRVLIGNKAHS